jgi:hypothetical protein
MFCEERGQLQYRLAEKKALEEAYNVRTMMHAVFFSFPSSSSSSFLFPSSRRGMEWKDTIASSPSPIVHGSELMLLQKHHRSDGKVTKEEFEAMSREVVKAGSFRVGKASLELGALLFGAPACALLAKRILPGLGWLSDDVVVPLATSGSVAYLIKSKRL